MLNRVIKAWLIEIVIPPLARQSNVEHTLAEHLRFTFLIASLPILRLAAPRSIVLDSLEDT